MTLEKVENTREALFAEAELYDRAAKASEGGATVVRGFVGGIDLESGSGTTAALKWAYPLLKGVRQGLWHEPPEFFREPAVVEAVRNLSTLDLTFDALVKAPQLRDLYALASAAPNTRINLNHLGYPPLGNSTGMAAWAADLGSLATLGNVYCKLSGLPQAFGMQGWNASAFAPAVDVAVAAFSPRRLNFAGNWFVLEEAEWAPAGADAYRAMLDAVDAALDAAGVYGDDRDRVYSGTAEALYRLDSRS